MIHQIDTDSIGVDTDRNDVLKKYRHEAIAIIGMNHVRMAIIDMNHALLGMKA